jgi:hypothetical protein
MQGRRSRSTLLTSGVALLFGLGLFLCAASVEAGPCRPGKFPASGQTTPDTAILQGGNSAVSVPDDGTVQAGADLRYKDNGNGTITDKNTGLVWEKKCSGCGGLHDVSNSYVWSNPSTPGANMTIWDWLAAVNSEGGKGFAGKKDWQIPNVKELESIVDYGRCSSVVGGGCADDAAIDPTFGPAGVAVYWSSTTFAVNPAGAWFVRFVDGVVDAGGKGGTGLVRAVRDGCVD